MKTKVYLASPYDHEDEAVRKERFEIASKAAAIMMKHGYIVHSPIAHNHPINKFISPPRGYEFWLEQDFAWLDACDEVWVLSLNGWKDSYGIKEEVYRALLKRIPVRIVPMAELQSWER